MNTTAGIARRVSADPSPSASLRASAASRVLSLAYGLFAYLCFFGTFLYVIGFVGGFVVPKHLHAGAAAPLREALLVNGAFLALFALQHAVMARPAFKSWWTRFVPVQIERSTFVLVTCAILGAMVWQWRPMPELVWQVEGGGALALRAVQALGWATVLLASFQIDHFELFGVRQVIRHFRGSSAEAPHFRERGLYRLVRHPLMLGFLLAFWSTPVMTQGHLFFAVMCTGYILVGTWIEERTLIALHGSTYLDYKRRVPGLLPLPRGAA